MSSPRTLQGLHIAWAQGTEFEPIVPLESQGQWAFTALVLALSLTGLFVLSDKSGVTNTLKSYLIAVCASVCFGFGSIFLIDTVGVYT